MYRVLVARCNSYICFESIIFSFLCRWQLNNTGFVLHNQTWRTCHVILIPLKLSVLYSMHSTSRSCLCAFLCNPYMPLHNLSPVFFALLLAEVYTHIVIMTPFRVTYNTLMRNFIDKVHDGLHRSINYSLLLLTVQPNSNFSMYIHACIYHLTVTKWNWVDSQSMASSLTSMSTRRLKIYSTATVAVSVLVFGGEALLLCPGSARTDLASQ